MYRFATLVGAVTVLMSPVGAHAQETITASTASQANVPPAVQQAEADVERAVTRFGIGLQGGVGLDPEILDVGVHAAVGPLFTPNVTLRPGIEVGLGEVTTLFGISLDVLYTMPGFTSDTRWLPYLGAGPNFGLSHRGFETDDIDNVDTGTTSTADNDFSRFDFSDTDFNGGMNFIVGMRQPSGMFFEMKATAWGVSNIRLLAGFNF